VKDRSLQPRTRHLHLSGRSTSRKNLYRFPEESEPSIRTAPAHSIRRRCALQVGCQRISAARRHTSCLPVRIVPVACLGFPRVACCVNTPSTTTFPLPTDCAPLTKEPSLAARRLAKCGGTAMGRASLWRGHRGNQGTLTPALHLARGLSKRRSPDTIRVELYADGMKGGSAVKYEMTRARQLPDRAGGYAYRTSVSSARPATDPLVEMTASNFRQTTDPFELMRESLHLDCSSGPLAELSTKATTRICSHQVAGLKAAIARC
jgi:hypothetical protein